MDLAQATQMLTWLDEERRRDKAELAKLQQRVEGQATEIFSQAKRMQDLEGRLASAQAQLTKFSQFDQLLQQFKDEVALMLKGHDEQRQKAEAEANRLRQIERGSQAKALSELRKQLQPLPRYEEELQLRRAEDQRLGQAILTLQQQVADLIKESDNRSRGVTYLEEQRRQDAKRIAELQQETTELLKTSEALSSKLQLLEVLGRRNEQRIAEFKTLESELRQAQRSFMETLQVNEQQRKRQMAEWAEEFEEQHRRMDEYATRMQRFTEQYEANKRALAALEKLEERLKQGQAEVAELQRLAEKRLKKQLEEWQAGNEKRWKQHVVLWEHQWHKQDRWNEEQAAKWGSSAKDIQAIREQVAALWETWREHTGRQIAEMQEYIVRAEESARDLHT